MDRRASPPTSLVVVILLMMSLFSSAAGGDAPSHEAEPATERFVENLLSGRSSWGELVRGFLECCGRDGAAYTAAMDSLEKMYREKETGGLRVDARARMRSLRRFLFLDLGLEVEPRLESFDGSCPDAVVQSLRGNCLGITLVCMDLGERMGWSLVPVTIPRHVFVRHGGDMPLNMETTLGGVQRRDRWYRKYFRLPESTPFREASPRDVAAHLFNNRGYTRLQRGERDASRGDFLRALRLLPDFPEAHVNLGVLAARGGHYRRAIEHFERALAHWPWDPELRCNRAQALLDLGETRKALEEALKLTPELDPKKDLDLHANLTLLVTGLRERLDPRNDWPSVQALVVGLNGTTLKIAPPRPGVHIRESSLPGAPGDDAPWVRAGPRLEWRASDAKEEKNSGGQSAGIQVSWAAWMEISRPGTHEFTFRSPGAIQVIIDGRVLVDLDVSPGDVKRELELRRGFHELQVHWQGETSGVQVPCSIRGPDGTGFDLSTILHVGSVRP